MGLEGSKRMKREDDESSPIDFFAKSGFFKDRNMPGTDTYDDGLNEKGRVVQPGSTSTESGGTYMEDKGPQDLVHRGRGGRNESSARQGGLRIVESDKMNVKDEAEGDEADKWLKVREEELRKKGGGGK